MDWTNLLRPWFLAESAASLSAAVLCAYGAVVAARVLRRFRVAETSEGQLALERRAELAAAVVEVALALQILAFVLLIFAADRAAGSLRGAMCAYGVFFASPWGPRALFVSAIAAIACGLWSVEHRLDLRARTSTWMRRKFEALLVVAPLVIASAVTSTVFFLDLDFGGSASCCSTALDADGAARFAGTPLDPRALAAGAFTLCVGATGFSAFYARRATKTLAWFAAASSVASAAASTAAVIWYVAPHVYETPVHTCPFCLLHGSAVLVGGPLFAAIATGGFCGLALAWTRLSPVSSEEPEAAAAFSTKLARTAAVAWALAWVFGIAPVLRYAFLTGGASLFGSSA